MALSLWCLYPTSCALDYSCKSLNKVKLCDDGAIASERLAEAVENGVGKLPANEKFHRGAVWRADFNNEITWRRLSREGASARAVDSAKLIRFQREIARARGYFRRV